MDKHFDNSHEGDDCYINEHWYAVRLPQFAVLKMSRIDGWGDTWLDVSYYIVVEDDMPPEVKQWFAETVL